MRRKGNILPSSGTNRWWQTLSTLFRILRSALQKGHASRTSMESILCVENSFFFIFLWAFREAYSFCDELQIAEDKFLCEKVSSACRNHYMIICLKTCVVFIQMHACRHPRSRTFSNHFSPNKTSTLRGHKIQMLAYQHRCKPSKEGQFKFRQIWDEITTSSWKKKMWVYSVHPVTCLCIFTCCDSGHCISVGNIFPLKNGILEWNPCKVCGKGCEPKFFSVVMTCSYFGLWWRQFKYLSISIYHVKIYIINNL